MRVYGCRAKQREWVYPVKGETQTKPLARGNLNVVVVNQQRLVVIHLWRGRRKPARRTLHIPMVNAFWVDFECGTAFVAEIGERKGLYGS